MFRSNSDTALVIPYRRVPTGASSTIGSCNIDSLNGLSRLGRRHARAIRDTWLNPIPIQPSVDVSGGRLERFQVIVYWNPRTAGWGDRQPFLNPADAHTSIMVAYFGDIDNIDLYVRRLRHEITVFFMTSWKPSATLDGSYAWFDRHGETHSISALSFDGMYCVLGSKGLCGSCCPMIFTMNIILSAGPVRSTSAGVD